MIKVTIIAKGETVSAEIEKNDSTLIENSSVLREMELVKRELLDIEYGHDMEWSTNGT